MSYTTLLNTYNATTSTLSEQNINKPHYTPSKVLKKAYKILRCVFKPSTTGKVIITADTQITAPKTHKVAEKQQKCQEAEAAALNDSVLTTCSTLSDEEYENELNELAEELEN